jgi:hypothetical protein
MLFIIFPVDIIFGYALHLTAEVAVLWMRTDSRSSIVQTDADQKFQDLHTSVDDSNGGKLPTVAFPLKCVFYHSLLQSLNMNKSSAVADMGERMGE